jgi:hypothetical protein
VGSLPKSINDLIDPEYFRLTDGASMDLIGPELDRSKHFIRGFPGTVITHIDKVDILYDGELHDFYVKNDRVVRKGTEGEIFFIRPRSRALIPNARSWTVELFQALDSQPVSTEQN